MKENLGLYDPQFEHDACGIGFVANIRGNKSHQNISDALTILENMEHRGACGCETNTGDGAGIFIQNKCIIKQRSPAIRRALFLVRKREINWQISLLRLC